MQPDVVADLLETPVDWQFIALLCIGWPEEHCDTPELERLGWQARQDWRDNVSER